MNDKNWNLLMDKAKKNLNSHSVSDYMECGSYSCAIMTDKGNVYSGINIESSLQGISAEKAAISNMLSNGETKITKLLVMNELEECILPIDDTYLYLMELGIDLDSISVFLKNEEVKMIELVPDWVGTFRIVRQ